MASISSVSGAQSGLQQLALQQAVRVADQAELTARSLQGQARAAQQDANRADENARAIATQANQAQVNAGLARQGVAVIKTIGQMQTQIEGVVAQVTGKQHAAEVAARPQNPTPPVVNAQGQVTGTVINTTA